MTPTSTTLRELDPRQLDPHPKNRTRFDPAKMAELQADIAASGVEVPLIVRRLVEGRYQILAGHRRHRCALALKLKSVPCDVRELNDDEAYALVVRENLHHEGLNPLDEADQFAELAGPPYHWTPEMIAAQLGKDERYVHGRLRLRELAPALRTELEEGKLSLPAALELAKLRHEDQGRVRKALAGGRDLSELSGRTVRKVIEDELLLDLGRAPFDLKDAALKPEAGACTECPFRTGSTPTLFDEYQGQRCLNAACYHDKTQRSLDARMEALKAKWPGLAVVRVSLERRYSGRPPQGALDRQDFVRIVDTRPANRCEQTKVGLVTEAEGGHWPSDKTPVGASFLICATPAGCKKHRKPSEQWHTSESSQAKAKKQDQYQARLSGRVRAETFKQLATHAPVARLTKDDDQQRLFWFVVEHLYHDTLAELCKVMGWPKINYDGKATEKGAFDPKETIAKQAATWSSEQLGRWTMTLIGAGDLKGEADDDFKPDSKRFAWQRDVPGPAQDLYALAKAWGVDVGALKKVVEAQLPKPKPSEKKKGKKKGRAA